METGRSADKVVKPSQVGFGFEEDVNVGVELSGLFFNER